MTPNTPFDYLLSKTDAPTCILAHITTPSAAEYFLSSCPYVSGAASEGELYPASTAYTPSIISAPRVRMGVDDLFSGRASVSWGELVLATDENVLAMFGVPGANIEIFIAIPPDYRHLYPAYLYPGINKFPSFEWRQALLKGRVSNYRGRDDGTVAITIQSYARTLFDKPFASTVFDGTNPATVPAENIGRRIPRLLGSCRQIAPVLVDASTLTYQFNHDANGTLYRAYDGGLDLVLTGTTVSATGTTITVETGTTSNDASYYNGCNIRIKSGTGAGQVRAISAYSAHVATVSTWTTNPDTSSVYEIELWTSPAANKIKLLTVPYFGLTVDAARLTGAVPPVQYILQYMLGLDAGWIVDQTGMTGATVGVYVDDASTYGEVLTRLCQASFSVWGSVPDISGTDVIDIMLARKCEGVIAEAVSADFEETSIFSYSVSIREDLLSRVTARDKPVWSRPGSLSTVLPAATAEWLRAGFVAAGLSDSTAANIYGSREVEFAALSYDSKASPSVDSTGEAVARRMLDLLKTTRKGVSVTVPAFFPIPFYQSKVDLTLPGATYGGIHTYLLLAWTIYTNADGVVLMDLELLE